MRVRPRARPSGSVAGSKRRMMRLASDVIDLGRDVRPSAAASKKPHGMKAMNFRSWRSPLCSLHVALAAWLLESLAESHRHSCACHR